MKINLRLLGIITTIALVSIFSFVGYSHAQSSMLETRSLSEYGIFIYVQTLIRNSDGQLVTYLGSSSFTNLDINALKILLDTEATADDPVFTIDDRKFQLIKREKTLPQQKENGIASTLLYHTKDGKTSLVARFAHDGYRIIEGDTVTSIWTFIRPVN